MGFVRDPTVDDTVHKSFFIIFAISSLILLLVQVIYLQKMRLFAVYLLPVLSFCIAFENCVLAFGSDQTDKEVDVILAKI